MDFIQVHTAIDSKEAAQRIAGEVVSRRLAACCCVTGPITSIYWWQGKLEQTEEWVCTIKTRRELYDELEKAIKEVHTYNTPEVLATPIVAGNKSYLDWIANETR